MIPQIASLRKCLVSATLLLMLWSCAGGKGIEGDLARGDTNFKQGRNFHDRDAMQRAIAEYGKALTLNPNQPQVYLKLGTLYN